jgi:energy-converting hydrogenase Eha subunit E
MAKYILILMLATLMTSLTFLCVSIISGNLVMFAVTTFISLISMLGACLLAEELDEKRL